MYCNEDVCCLGRAKGEDVGIRGEKGRVCDV